jgi:hypothetical protein
MLYKLMTGRHSRIEGTKRDGTPIRKLYRPGNLIDLTRAEAKKFGIRVQPHIPHVDDPVDDLEVLAATEEASDVEVAQPTPTDDATDADEAQPVPVDEDADVPDDPAPDPDAWAEVNDMNVPEVEELIESMEDPADLRGVYAAEESGKQRVGVFNAVRFRLAALTDADSAPDDEAGDEGDSEE